MKVLAADITSECNLACEYCYSEGEGELSLDDVKAIVEEHEPDRVEVGGGEPLMHPHLREILEYLSGEGKKISLATNGTLIENDFLDFAEGIDGLHFQVSLPAVFYDDWSRIAKGKASSDAISNAKLLKSRGFSVAFSCPVYSGNYHCVRDVIQAAEAVQVPVRFGLVFPVGKGKDVERLNPIQVEELRALMLEERLRTQGLVESQLIRHNGCPALEDAYGLQRDGDCHALTGNKIYVAPDKKIHKCEFYRRCAG